MSLYDALRRGGWLRAIDEALADALRQLRPDTDPCVLAAAALASHAVAHGHSGLPLARIDDLLREIAPERVPPPLPSLAEWRQLLAASPWVATPLAGAAAAAPAEDPHDPTRGFAFVLEADRLYLRRYHDYERRLASALCRLAGAADTAIDDAWLRQRLRALFPVSGDGAPDAQALAALAALRRRLLLLTGGPGTGKTTTVARLLALLVEQALQGGGDQPRIALAAPTGKAATRLSEALRDNLARLVASGALDEALAARIPSEAKTLHRLLGWQPGRTGFRHHAGHPLAADLVIVDEASMIDLPLMTKLVEAVPPGARLVLIGDRDQLPSVETGDVLAALCDAAGQGDGFDGAFAEWAGGLLGAPVAVCDGAAPLAGARVHLRRTYRQDGGLALAPLAARIRAGEAEAAIAGLQRGDFASVAWRQGSDRALAEQALASALPYYRAVAAAPDPAEGLRRARGFRVLAALREGAAGARTLDAQLADALRPNGAGELFHGRLLIVTENSYRHGLFNGDMGLCWRESDGTLRVWFDTADGLRPWLPAALPAHAGAFALTVHKSQGSEFDEVLLALPERDARVLGRELLYTGLTRARRAVTLWAREEVLRAAIARRTQRWSGLVERLR